MFLKKIRSISLFTMMAGALLLQPFFTSQANADPKSEAEELVVKAGYSLTRLWNNEQIGSQLQKYIGRAVGIIIVPQSLSGGFIIGGEGGTGALLAKGTNGWGYPVFVNVGSASIGLQFGAQSSESVYLIMTASGLEAILNDHVKIGGNLRGAVGPHGAGVDASSTTDLNLDILAWSVSKGAFLGASVAGTAFMPREALNRGFYQQSNVIPSDVVLKGAFSNPQADSLRILLQEYSAR